MDSSDMIHKNEEFPGKQGGQNGGEQAQLLRQARKHFSSLGFRYFLGTIIVFAVQLLATAVVLLLKPEWMNNLTISLLVSMLSMYVIAMPVMFLLVSRVSGEPVAKKGRLTFGQMLIAFMMCYSIMYLSNLVGILVTFVIGLMKGSGVNNAIEQIAMEGNQFVNLFLMVLCAPVLEELIFRKLLVDKTVKYGEGAAVLLSGLLFGLFHGNLSQFAYAFTLGLFFAFLYVKTGRIRYTIILHMIINFMGSIVSVIVMKASGYTEFMKAYMNFAADPSGGMEEFMAALPKAMIMLGYSAAVLGIVIAGLVLLIVKRKRFRLAPGSVTIPRGRRFATIFLNIGMGLFILFWVVYMAISTLM